GVVEGITVLEQAMDELAAALGLDPLELRRRNHVDRDQASGLPYSSKRLLACYDRAAELADWGAGGSGRGARRARARPRAARGGRGARARGAASRGPTACCAGWAVPPRSGGAGAGRPP